MAPRPAPPSSVSPVLAVLAILAASLPLAAQAQRPASLATAPFRVDVGLGLARVDGRLLGVGPHYKVGFAAGGIEFVPAFGNGAPHDLPLRWRAVEVARGSDPVALRVVEPAAGERTVEYHRGAVVERYELRADGVEQSFVFDTLPPGDGDLVVRGELTTALAIEPGREGGDAGEGLRLRAPGIGSFGLGEVTGVDARGRRCRGSLRADGGGLELRLPAAFVADAALPLVLDPLIGTGFALETASSDDRIVDVAYEPTTNTAAVVWEHPFSATDHDVYLQRIDYENGPVGSIVYIESSTSNAQLPSVAAVRAVAAFVVSWQVGTSVFARAVDAATGATGAVLTVTTNGQRADVGGLLHPTARRAACVWQSLSSYSIVGSILSLNGLTLSLATGPNIVLAGSSTAPYTWPRISKTAGTGCRGGCDLGVEYLHHHWAVVGQREWSTDTDLRVAVLDWNAAAITSYALDATLADHELGDVDGDGQDFVVAWHQRVTSTDDDLLTMSFSYVTGSSSISTTSPVRALGRVVGRRERRAAVGWLGQSCLIGCMREPSAGLYAPYLATVSLDGCEVCDGLVPLGMTANAQAADVQLAMATKWSTPVGNDGGRALVVGAQLDPNLANAGQVTAWYTTTSDGLEQRLGGTCGDFAGTSGTTCALLGNSAFRVWLRDGTPNATAWLVLSPSLTALGCGACRLAPDPFEGFVLGAALDATGRGAVALPLPSASALQGCSFYTQWLVPNATNPACATYGVDFSAYRRTTIQ